MREGRRLGHRNRTLNAEHALERTEELGPCRVLRARDEKRLSRSALARGREQHRGHEIVDVQGVADSLAGLDERDTSGQELVEDLAAVNTCMWSVDHRRLHDR